MKVTLDNQDYLNVAQAARRIGVSDETVRRWIRAGTLSSTRFGLQHLILERHVEELVKARANRGATQGFKNKSLQKGGE